jgi:Zn finger protein HypA/HybF involved in hydrogenase expression
MEILMTRNKYCHICCCTQKFTVNGNDYKCPKCGIVSHMVVDVKRDMVGTPWNYRTNFDGDVDD